MKTLYSILGLAPDASSAQIETAYAELLAKISDSSGENERLRMIAIKEAYSVLSDPIKRQVYNQKLYAPEAVTRGNAAYSMQPEISESSGLKKILLIGIFAIGGLALYSHNASEREKMRIEHEHEVQVRAVQVFENTQQQAAAAQEARLERQKLLDAQAKERQEKADFDRFNREADARRMQSERAEQQSAQQAMYEQEQKNRQQANEARQRAAREEAELRRLEREQYGSGRGRVVSINGR